jgi:hypothetical protein
VGSLERQPVRRYPLYWDSRSSKGEAAQRLLAQHSGIGVTASTADVLFSELLARLDALDRLAEPPLTTALAVTRLKRLLPDPVRRIDLHDLVMDVTQQTVSRIGEFPVHADPPLSFEGLQAIYDGLLEASRPLMRLLSTAVFHDSGREHLDLWVAVLQRLLQARATITGSTFTTALDAARHYPALLTMRAAGIVAGAVGRDDLLLALYVRPTWRDPFNNQPPMHAVDVLHDSRVLSGDNINRLPRWEGTRWLFPQSHMLRVDLRDVLVEWLPAYDDYVTACDRYEFRAALAQATVDPKGFGYTSASGEFNLDSRWRDDDGPQAEISFREEAAQAGDEWAWWPLVGGRDGLDATLIALREYLQRLRRFG